MDLTIENIISESFKSIKSNFSFFLMLILIFFVVSGILEFLFWQLETESFLVIVFFSLLDLAVYAKFAVIVHRTVILDDEKVTKELYSWCSNDGKFFLLSLGLFIALIVFVMLVNFVFVSFIFSSEISNQIQLNLLIINFIPMLVAGIIFSRICLVFPSIAVKKELSLGDSFELTKNHKFKMFILIVMLPLVTNFLISELFSLDSLMINIVVNLILLLVIVFGITLLSNTYIALTKDLKPDDEEQRHKI